jgi:hypothetical protein
MLRSDEKIRMRAVARITTLTRMQTAKMTAKTTVTMRRMIPKIT